MKKMSIIKFSFLCICIFIFNSAGISRTAWEYYYKKGVIEYKADMYTFAIDNLIKALDRNPSLYKAQNIIAEIYIKLDRKEEAIKHYRMSLNINDNQPDIHCKIGKLYEFYLEYSLSHHHYSRAVNIDPSHLKGHYNLVRYYVKKNNKDSAIK